MGQQQNGLSYEEMDEEGMALPDGEKKKSVRAEVIEWMKAIVAASDKIFGHCGGAVWVLYQAGGGNRQLNVADADQRRPADCLEIPLRAEKRRSSDPI